MIDDRPRPIIVKFTRWKQKGEILRAARQKKPMEVMFYPDLAKRTLQRRAVDIPRLVAEAKLHILSWISDDQDDEVFINVSGRNRR